MKIFVFGNQDLKFDSLPLRILPKLQELYPKFHFEVKDPNEEWKTPRNLIVIDTVSGIEEVRLFKGLAFFQSPSRTSLHDFDALSNLLFLKKLGRISQIKIIGVPPMMPEIKALESVSKIIQAISSSENGRRSSYRDRKRG